MKLMASVFGLTLALMMFSCDGTGTRNNDTETDSVNNDLNANNESWDHEEKNDFVEKAAHMGMKEVKAGEVAQTKAQDADIKEFAQMLVNDHRKSNQELMNIARQSNLTVPDSLDSDHQDHVKKLQDADRNNFRSDFLDMMEKDHDEAIKEFEDASENVQDQQLKTWIDNQLTVLRKHKEQVKALKEKQN